MLFHMMILRIKEKAIDSLYCTTSSTYHYKPLIKWFAAICGIGLPFAYALIFDLIKLSIEIASVPTIDQP